MKASEKYIKRVAKSKSFLKIIDHRGKNTA